MRKLTPVQESVIHNMRYGGAVLRTHTAAFPPYAEYLYCGINMNIQWKTFEALKYKGAIKYKHSNCWEIAS